MIVLFELLLFFLLVNKCFSLSEGVILLYGHFFN